MKDTCGFCQKERDVKWALLFGPPFQVGFNITIDCCEKIHICPACFNRILQLRKPK